MSAIPEVHISVDLLLLQYIAIRSLTAPFISKTEQREVMLMVNNSSVADLAKSRVLNVYRSQQHMKHILVTADLKMTKDATAFTNRKASPGILGRKRRGNKR
ncbi:hypothetical protein CHS0354_010228 [Potamilus streckersoni]|uniref:Uncharacterized protein n=1 Tax=Potamilus streckersoni TaxID=2493646 RepID=A0AAE0RSV1_9BIVA|nr:hypothetical protein CHS0354_010228 [Potamilus streckersoni]